MGDRNDNILEVRNITKYYPGVTAIDDMSLSFKKGEVHALMGENGAGKSTLIKIIAGAVIPDAGTIIFDGKNIEKMSTKVSKDLGISVIYQELMMIPALTVAENVFLGNKMLKGKLISYKTMQEKSKEIFDQLGIEIDPEARVGDLTVAYQQMIEIARALMKDAKVLIMDEPSAVLTEDEVETMFKVIERLKKAGVTIIYISHRLEEVFRISDRISVMRDGKYIVTLDTDKTNKAELIHYMVGRDLTEKFPEADYESGDVGI